MSSFYCRCKYCKYVDSHECDGHKWYCTLFRRYVDPEELIECNEYREA